MDLDHFISMAFAPLLWRRSAILLTALVAATSSQAESRAPQNQGGLIGPLRPEMLQARSLKVSRKEVSGSEIAREVFIGPEYKQIIAWMRQDLENYLANFDDLFAQKLGRIHKNYRERKMDLDARLAPLFARLKSEPSNPIVAQEIARIKEVHRIHAFVDTYKDGADFARKFIGPKGKLLKSSLTPEEMTQMNRPGLKRLYVDTWAVPFFNTGTQTWSQARAGVAAVVARFQQMNLREPISVLQFTDLMAHFARPEFDDVRRYKLKPFPSTEDKRRFGNERSDALTFGGRYPNEDFIASNVAVELEPLSYLFGQKIHWLGLISHAHDEVRADGRIFTGPADFLEHDYAHAFFNLAPMVPGTAEDWQEVHELFVDLFHRETSLPLKSMMRLVYFHFTHESGFKSLLAQYGGSSAFAKEIDVIKEQIHTRHYYDWVPTSGNYPGGFEPYLNSAFATVSGFFESHFLRIQALEHQRTTRVDCDGILE